MCESGFGPEIGNGHGLLERERAGHDFAIDGAKGVVGDGSLIFAGNALENGTLAVRGVDFFASFEFDFADGEDVFGALVEELDNVGVELVDSFAMFGNSHRWKMTNDEQRMTNGM